jgi:hypothetical protein
VVSLWISVSTRPTHARPGRCGRSSFRRYAVSVVRFLLSAPPTRRNRTPRSVRVARADCRRHRIDVSATRRQCSKLARVRRAVRVLPAGPRGTNSAAWSGTTRRRSSRPRLCSSGRSAFGGTEDVPRRAVEGAMETRHAAVPLDGTSYARRG